MKKFAYELFECFNVGSCSEEEVSRGLFTSLPEARDWISENATLEGGDYKAYRREFNVGENLPTEVKL